MEQFLALFARHGYFLLAVIVFAEANRRSRACGVGPSRGRSGVCLARDESVDGSAGWASSMVIGDTIMFFVGRVSGWNLLGFLCRVSMNPETCILRSAESFYKRGKATLLIAKFVPGLNTMAPPLAAA